MSLQRPLYVGIDLGTTNSAAAVFDGERVDLVRTAQGATLTPSVVRIDARGKITVGERARRQLDQDPNNVRAEFKRLMGSAHRLSFAAAGVDKAPEELAAEVSEGQRAAKLADQAGLEQAVRALRQLEPLDQAARKRGHSSGVH